MKCKFAPGGAPIVGEGDTCPYWEPGNILSISTMRECWFCKWSDFRKDMTSHKTESLCHNEHNFKEKIKNRDCQY